MDPDKVYVGIGGSQPAVGIVDCRTGQTETLMLPAGNSVYAVDVGITDKILACGTGAGCARIYSLSSHNSLEELPYIYVGRPVIGIAVYPGFKAITLDTAGRVISWRLDKEIRFRILPQKRPVHINVKLPNGLLAGVADGMVQLWDIASEELIGQLSFAQKGPPTDAVFWTQYNQLIIGSQSGLYSWDINADSCQAMPDCVEGDWRLFTAGDNLYSLETQSGILYRWSEPELDAQQTMLCRGVTEAAMAGDKVVVIDSQGYVFQYAVFNDGVQYAGRLPWRDCLIVATVAEFERADYQQKAKAAQISQLRAELDRAVGQGESDHVRQLIGKLGELGDEQDAELLLLNLARSSGDIADEIGLLSRMIEKYPPDKLKCSVTARYLEVLVQIGQLEQALGVYDQFDLPDYCWLEDLRDPIDDGEYVIDPTLPITKIIQVHSRLNIPLDATFVLNRCEPIVIPDLVIAHTELANKLCEIAASQSLEQLMGQELRLYWQHGHGVGLIDTLTLAAWETSDSYVLIPSLRFIRRDSGTIIEPVLLFSASCQDQDPLEHNGICLAALNRLQKIKPERFWPDYLYAMISQALVRIENTKHIKPITLGD
ncbi:MAG: WD40 repeat domain-containing protein [Planctomycetes bacterium]|nr:WD40 repeat domain-containing protein [Planctomycetota bacterium]